MFTVKSPSDAVAPVNAVETASLCHLEKSHVRGQSETKTWLFIIGCHQDYPLLGFLCALGSFELGEELDSTPRSNMDSGVGGSLHDAQFLSRSFSF